MKVTQPAIDRQCRAASQRYLGLPHKRARVKFSSEVQGFVAAEVERGATVDQAISLVAELLVLIRKANDHA